MTIIAAYADPCRVLALMMIPALAHGIRLFRILVPEMVGICPVSDVTRPVMSPFPVSGRCTK